MNDSIQAFCHGVSVTGSPHTDHTDALPTIGAILVDLIEALIIGPLQDLTI